jgi:hypothetical protein
MMMIREAGTHGPKEGGPCSQSPESFCSHILHTHDFGVSGVCVYVCDEPIESCQSSFGGGNGNVIYGGLEE